MVRSAFLKRQNFIRQHGCVSYKQQAPVKMNNCAEADAWLRPMDTSASKWVILTASSCVLMGYVYVYDSTKINTENVILPWCTGATEGACISLRKHCSGNAHRPCHIRFKKNNAFQVKWCWKHKTTNLKVNEFKLHESFDHFMLLVMRTYIMRTQYERKRVFQQTFFCCSWTNTSNISRSFHTECLVWRKLLALL